ncbi:MAG: bifunctional UDP-N-acetylmuramoyl-tripeptide:D-alanyl-D-alanine ligase/alanine racemase [Bacteroidota bacterium]
MITYPIEEIEAVVKGRLSGNAANAPFVKDLIIDSRNVSAPANALFFAIVGKRNDGHRYLRDLYIKGVRNFVVSTLPEDIDTYENACFILVEDTLKALQAVAANHRKKFNIPVIGITGSNGKTIVKEWLFMLLSQDKRIVRSPKSYNSQVGVPLSVWQMQPEHDIAIFEAGISEPDEMDKLQPVIQPTIGIFTNIGAAHDKNFINTMQKVGEKLKLFTKVKTMIYCPDYFEIQDRIIKSEIFKNIHNFSWSRKLKSNMLITGTEKKQSETLITATYNGETISIVIPFIDNASVENAIHCWALMLHLGYENSVIASRMLQLSPVAMRLEMNEGINNCSVINDSYNSDINSIGIALDFLNQQKQHKKKTLILSDILQSSLDDDTLYSEVAKLISEKGVARLIGIGKAISRQASKFDIEKVFYPDTESFLKELSPSFFHNETILLKGARAFEFEQIGRMLQQKSHETVLEINLNALVHNLNYYRSRLKPETKIMAMVKAFSYGSGSYEIASTLQYNNVDYLAVAYADEGVELRRSGITVPIMVMSPEEQSLDILLKYNLEPEIYSFRVLNLLKETIRIQGLNAGMRIPVHIKLDTGMHRLGFDPGEVDELIAALKEEPLILVRSVFSHLAASDETKHDEFTRKQIDVFREAGEKIKSAFDEPVLMHLLNSSGINRFGSAQFEMVRLGIGMYGIAFDKKEQSALQNVSTLKSVISQIKTVNTGESVGYGRKWIAQQPTRIATVPIGYADGLDRKLGDGKGKLIIRGKSAPIIGSICMDMCMCDISGIDAAEGDEVTIFNNEFSIKELAAQLETIPYEILTNLSRRVKRIYYYE